MRRKLDQVRANDPCPCGSGKKFKRCCAEDKDSEEAFEVFLDQRAIAGIKDGPEIRDPSKSGIVVKVQLPFDISTGTLDLISGAMIYDRERTFRVILPVTEDLISRMEGNVKSFFYAKVLEGKVELLEPAPWQEW